jgi:(S)-ureidoglycine aminohydrolase
MSLFGFSRSHVARDHALLAPESFVRSTLPGWKYAEVVILISPAMGARFTQYLALMESGAIAGPVQADYERVVFVLEGEVLLKSGQGSGKALGAGGFAYLPPGEAAGLQARTASRLNVFEKRYQPLAAAAPPPIHFGQEQDIEGQPFLGDPDARLQTLLPAEPAFDLAVNVFTFRPGAALPLVEVHVMEHGLLMLEGQGVYRLGDCWYPVRQGDVIWMAPYCPQWFVAMGKGPARYLYYKDVNRGPSLSGAC